MLQLKTHTLVDDYEYICRSDPAVDDNGTPEFEEKWRLYEDGMGECPLKPGLTPTIFTLRHLRLRHLKKLSPYLHRAKKGPEYSIEAVWAVASVALADIANQRDANGKNFRLVFDRDDDGEQIVAADTLEALGIEIVSEIASVALTRSTSTPLS